MKQLFIKRLLVLSIAVLALHAETMSVQVKSGSLRKAPSFLSAVMAKLPYGKPLTVLNRKNSWVHVQAGKKKGWMHANALREGRIVVRSGRSRPQMGASSDEIMLAGKGFNPETEAAHKRKNPKLRYDVIDKMERFRIDSSQLARFAKSGKLNTGALQ